jgi:transcriptional regulator with XRE-family HTH domain
MERELQFNWLILVEEAVRRRHGLKLTQKQLASLAKVSTPTISRFEQAAKDIQLSSVLAILGVLGMIDKRTLIFDAESHRDVDDTIVFWGNDDEKRVRCGIERKALDDHFSEGGRLRFAAAFKKHRPEIEALARRKYFLGQRESDESVLIRTRNLS